ncbi:MAG: CDF family Co(II)/Ni(II) efflux transporter DmeF [Desulfamplus sp.]|nr:CDF family Co(II)/Ni(II) efflux transporter DmeF [Desulfamplus sp.]
MHVKTLQKWQHNHNFAIIDNKGEQRTIKVLTLTVITMAIEIIAGLIYGSMALLADGWHMGTHASAFIITIFAYRYAKKHQNNPEFTFGIGKVSVLGGFSSAVALAMVALVMSVESMERIINPQDIYFNQAIGVAVFGLIINGISAFILQDNHHHHTDKHKYDDKSDEHKYHKQTNGDKNDKRDQTTDIHHHYEHHHHHDHNLKAAYFHVLADALTSVLAIVALFAGKIFGLHWLDPVMGIVGALVIIRWSYILLKETSPILLDKNIEKENNLIIREKIESDSDNRICDLHLWKVGPDDYAAIISLVTHFPKPTEHYKNLLQDIKHLSHLTIEINQCMDKPCIAIEN